MSRIGFTVALLVAAGLLAYLFSLGVQRESPERYQTVGDFPRDHVWFNTSEPLSLYGQLSGHIVLVLFCDCRSLIDVRELSMLQSITETFADSPVAVLVALDNSSHHLDSLRGVIRQDWGITFPVILDSYGGVASNFHVGDTPTLLILETRARVAASYGSSWYERDLESLVGDLLSQGIASRSLAHDPYHPDPAGEYLPDPLPWAGDAD